jgi:alkylated DNA repair dioxygenase AlkB
MAATQLDLLAPPQPVLPEGFAYRANIISPDEEAELVGHIRELPFREFEFQGYLGKRRVVSFGLHYDFAERAVRRAEPISDFLLPLRARAAAFADIPADDIEQALVTEYTPGAAIGWHRDRPVFGDVIGVSLLSACRFRLRRKHGAGWERAAPILEPRSIYLLRGPVRSEWEHSIAPAEHLRYSITFRTPTRTAAPTGGGVLRHAVALSPK